MTARHRHVWLLAVLAALMGGLLLLYSVLPVAKIMVGVGSGAVAIVVMVHLGILAAFVASFVMVRRRARRQQKSSRPSS